MLTLPSRLLLVAVLAASLTACDASDPAGGDSTTPPPSTAGRFSADVSGDATAALSGLATVTRYAEGGETVTAVGLLDADDPRNVVALVIDGEPRVGTFTVTPEDPASRAGAVVALADGTGDGALYAATAGTITITRVTDDGVAGRFEVEAALVADEPEVGASQPATVTVSGSFDAERVETTP